MGSLNVDVTLRPIRFGFVIRPNDSKHIKQIFQINTCLWGGVFNPIIPYFNRLPKWWERNDIRFENAKQVINGHLDFFEPDFIVEAEKNIANGLGFAPDRILQLSDILQTGGEKRNEGFGLSVFDIYRKLYKDSFQFVHRHKTKIIHVHPKQAIFGNFTSCVFGSFPQQKNQRFFEEGYQDAFDPELINLDPESMIALYKSRYFSPLAITEHQIKARYHNTNWGPVLFIMDANETKDLIDFWNLRATHNQVIAIPIQWIKELSEYCKSIIIQSARPLPGNKNGVMIRATTIFSRSIHDKNIENLYSKYIKVDKENVNVLQTWYPPIWRQSPSYTTNETRATLSCQNKKFYFSPTPDNQEIKIEPLYPDFSDDHNNKFSCANVVQLTSWYNETGVATTFPCDYKNPRVPNFQTTHSAPLSSTEGLVVFPRFKDIAFHWTMMSGTEAVSQWLVSSNINNKLSESGRFTQQIINTLGGIDGVRSIAHKGVIELLNEMSRKPITKTTRVKVFKERIKNSTPNERLSTLVHESLIKRKAVELGLEVKCVKCSSWGWHELTDLGYSLLCQFCMQDFHFPVSTPENSNYSRWAYRVVGPFALPDYAKGGYASALSIRFLSSLFHTIGGSETTWSAAQELTFADGKIIEADFILWYQRRRIAELNHKTNIVFGEAKSFGKDAFKDVDIERMMELAKKFPGSILVFSTMKEPSELSRSEITILKKLALWGRERDKQHRGSRAAIVLLTGIELFSDGHDLASKWKKMGGLHEKLAKDFYRIENLKVLADITQQLYLGMQSYGEWFMKKVAVRKKNKKTTI